MGFSKFRAAVVDLWHFSSPALIITGILSFVTAWIAPDTTLRTIEAIKPFVRPPSPEIRQGLVFLGLDKLIPVITAFIFVLVVYLIRRTAETVGGMIPPHVSIAPANIATRVIGNVIEKRLRVHFRTDSDQELWDRALEYASSLNRGKSQAATNVNGLRRLQTVEYEAWLRCKFVAAWVVISVGLEWHSSAHHRTNVARATLLFFFASVAALIYFFRYLSAWKSYVWAVMMAAQVGMVEDPNELDAKALQLRVPDNKDAFFSPFSLS